MYVSQLRALYHAAIAPLSELLAIVRMYILMCTLSYVCMYVRTYMLSCAHSDVGLVNICY